MYKYIVRKFDAFACWLFGCDRFYGKSRAFSTYAPLRVIVFFFVFFFLFFLHSVGFAFAVPSPWCYLLYILHRILKSHTIFIYIQYEYEVRPSQRVIYSFNLCEKAAIIFSSRFHFFVRCHGPDQMNERTIPEHRQKKIKSFLLRLLRQTQIEIRLTFVFMLQSICN